MDIRRECTKCKRLMPVSYFAKQGKRKDGSVKYASRCKECIRDINLGFRIAPEVFRPCRNCRYAERKEDLGSGQLCEHCHDYSGPRVEVPEEGTLEWELRKAAFEVKRVRIQGSPYFFLARSV